jgi:hypothetical protein
LHLVGILFPYIIDDAGQNHIKFVTDNIKDFYSKLEQTYIQRCKGIQFKELICKQDFPLFSSHSSKDCEVQTLQRIQLISQSCTQMIVDFKEILWINLRENTWIYVAPVPEHITVLSIGQKPTDTEITGSGVLTFLSVSTGYGTIFIIRSLPILFVNNTDKSINQPFYLTRDCCEMTVDVLLLGEIQLETKKKASRPKMGICSSQTTNLKMFRNLLMNRNGRLGMQQERICQCYL